ncbi:hypothetical protein ACFE04_003496 [Oxalis oulophora]
MAWCEGVDEVRLLIAPTTTDSSETGGEGIGRIISLRHPKSGTKTCYLLNNHLLQEIHWFKQSYGSWFLGDYVSQDGSLYTATPIDPVFLLLPLFEEARMKKGNDPGKFRQLDEIIFVADYPEYQHLLSIAENCMQVVCEIKEVGSLNFFRLDDSKVLAWMYHKACQLKKALPTLDQNYAARDDKDTMAEAVSILAEYLKDEPWLNLFCRHLKLNLQEATRKGLEIEASPFTAENNIDASNTLQQKNGHDKKNVKTGRQVKKAKVETSSHNIKDMFTRATRKRS